MRDFLNSYVDCVAKNTQHLNSENLSKISRYIFKEISYFKKSASHLPFHSLF